MTTAVPSFDSFKKDLGEFFAIQLTLGGYEFPRDEDAWGLAALYYALRMRTISRRSRVVHWSAELQAKRVILAADTSLALNTIEAESLAGEDLNPRMSRRQNDVECHNDLFNDWGILHLHLGARSPRTGELARGTSNLLFVVVREDAIYFVDQRSHGAFSDDDLGLIEIIHRNWPELIAHARTEDQDPTDPTVSPGRALVKLRKAGFIVPTVLSDGACYIVPGGGVVRSKIKNGKRGRLNGDAVSCANELFNRAFTTYKWCRENAAELIDRIRVESGVTVRSLEQLHLGLDDKGLFVVEYTSSAIIRFKSQ